MAGDWLAIRLDLFDDPAVVSISAKLNIDPDAVVGKLAKLWSWANRHLQDGIAKGITVDWIDRYVSATGFAEAMIESGWLQYRSECIQFPKFDVWNSASAKRRLLETRRKQEKRVSAKCPQNVRKMSASHADKNGTREEKRREEKEDPPNPPEGERSVILFSDIPEPIQEQAMSAYTAYCQRRWGNPPALATEQGKKDLREIAGRLMAYPFAAKRLSDYFANPPKDRPINEKLWQIFNFLGLEPEAKPKHKPTTTAQSYKDFTAERLAAQMGVG